MSKNPLTKPSSFSHINLVLMHSKQSEGGYIISYLLDRLILCFLFLLSALDLLDFLFDLSSHCRPSDLEPGNTAQHETDFPLINQNITHVFDVIYYDWPWGPGFPVGPVRPLVPLFPGSPSSPGSPGANSTSATAFLPDSPAGCSKKCYPECIPKFSELR